MPILKRKLPKKELISGIGVETKGESVYLYLKLEKDPTKIIRVARSTDGLNFCMYQKVSQISLKQNQFSNIEALVKPRKEYFDNGKIKIEGVVNLVKGYLVIYHVQDEWSNVMVGSVLFSKGKKTTELWRSEHPLWESSTRWSNKKVMFVGLTYVDGRIIGYWNVDGQAIYSVIYPSYKARTSQVADSVNFKLDKAKENPILSPSTQRPWEAWNTFNPAAVYVGGKVHILYRAQGFDYVSVVGYASSKDGVTIDERLSKPIYVPREPFEWRTNKVTKGSYSQYASGGGYGGVEDPRITQVGDKIYMTYVAFNGIDPPRVAITSIKVEDFLNHRWFWEKPVLISPPGVVDKGPAVFPEKINGKYVITHRIFPDILIDFVDSLDFDGNTWLKGEYRIKTRPNMWDAGKIGTGAPPIKTKAGWLLIYYGTPYDYAINPNAYNPYLIGTMLLDLNDPTKVLHRSKLPILRPTEDYENSGFKAGVVFPCGAVVVGETLFVYYGGADSYVCVATANLNTFIDQLRYTEEPIMEPATISRVM